TPPEPYCNFADYALTDRLHGGATYKDSWVGWEDEDVSITVDLGSVRAVSSFDADFLQQLGAWVLQPLSVEYLTSTDGVKFSPAGKVTLDEDRTPQVKFVHTPLELDTPINARYVRLNIEATKKCPEWHYGVGNPCWFMIDEITVK
ncbi:MAG: discoidin domain-containing protein, partial [Paramuribaculum sp.]|nr:discoidin domain-containing protein [Paramuribaculum sp.]